MKSPREMREEFTAEHATEENPYMQQGGMRYYPDGARMEVGGGGNFDLLMPPPDPEKRTYGTKGLLDFQLKYWELRLEYATNIFNEAREDSIRDGYLYKTITDPPFRRGNIRIPASTRKVAMTEAETMRELKRLRKEARHCQREYHRLQEALNPPQPEQVIPFDYKRHEFEQEIKKMKL